MKQRVITGVLFTLAVLLFVIPSYWIPLLIVVFSVIVGAVSCYEMIKALKAGNFEPSVPLIVTGAVMSLVLFVFSVVLKLNLTTALTSYLLLILMYCFACVIIPSITHKEGNHLIDGIISGTTILYITFPLFCLCAITVLIPNGWFYMIPALFSSWVSDVCAYFVGVTIGKHKIVPHISPKKTWEGCIGGAIGCAILITLYFDMFIYNLSEIKMSIVMFSVVSFVLGFIISVMSQLGDWTASIIKRRVGIKDYGNIFPGHGGMLDRFDSVFFTVPVCVFLCLISILFV